MIATDQAPSTALSVDGVAPIEFTEQGGPVPVAPNAVITDGGSFSDGYIQFSVDGGTADETLFLPSSSAPDATDGAVSVVGDAVFLGLGGTAKQIGTVDPTNDGRNGRPLRVNFSAALTNADFSGGVVNGVPVGWEINRSLRTLGSLASKTQGRPVSLSGSGPYTVSGSGYSFTSDVAYLGASRAGWANEGAERPGTSGTFTSEVRSYEGQAQALHLYFTGNCPGQALGSVYCSAFGPDAWSSPFDAKAGDDLAFDWAAAYIQDDYEVYGFLVNVASGEHTELMYGRGRHRGWTTTAGKIPADGTYRFRFVAGSYDGTGGLVIGASLYIDNARVLSSDASAAVAQSVMRMVHYDSTSQNPPPTRTINIEVKPADEPVTGTSSTATVELVDDAPTIASIANAQFTNTVATDTFTAITGVIPATDPEGDPITYGIGGGTSDAATVGGVGYTHSLAGTYGTLRINASTGAYIVVPNDDAINARLSPDSEMFTVTATANGLTGQQTLTLDVLIASSAPGSPTSVDAQPGDGVAEVSWNAPAWTGGSPVSGYRIETSTDGTNWTVAIANTGSTATSATVPGLNNGVPVLVRVAAINGNGVGDPSTPDSVTPRSAPEAPTSLTVTPADQQVSLTWTAPAHDGGAPITGYRIETSTDGTNWTVAIANTGSTAAAATVIGLTNGDAVSFRVAAINIAGAGDASTPTEATPRRAPDAPTALAATPADQQVTLTWIPPNHDGGAPITGYRIDTSTDGTNWTVVVADTGSTDTSHIIDGLSNGTELRFRVAAINVAGDGSPSTPVAAAARTTAGAPTITSIIAGNRSLAVSIAPPTDDGGAAIVDYEYSTDGGVTWQRRNPTSTSSPLIIAPLTNDTTYPVVVRAVNAAGPGASSVMVPAAPRLGPVLPTTPETPLIPSGNSKLLIGGVEREVRVFDAAILGDPSIPAGTLRVAGDGFTIDLRGVDGNGVDLRLDAQGRLIVVAGAYAAVSGEGFLPGSTVDVWLMSTPILLGEVTVRADGTFSALLALPEGIEPGPHTLQLNGISADNQLRSVSVAVVVRDANAQIAFTGSDTAARLVWSPLLIGFGLLLHACTKRRRRSRNVAARAN